MARTEDTEGEKLSNALTVHGYMIFRSDEDHPTVYSNLPNDYSDAVEDMQGILENNLAQPGMDVVYATLYAIIENSSARLDTVVLQDIKEDVLEQIGKDFP